VPRRKACDGIYLGDTVVTNRNGRAYLYTINSTDEDKALIVPINLNEIEELFEQGDNITKLPSISDSQANDKDTGNEIRDRYSSDCKPNSHARHIS
jgi:hypothetical protein